MSIKHFIFLFLISTISIVLYLNYSVSIVSSELNNPHNKLLYSDSTILIVVKHEYSLDFTDYTRDDFEIDDIKSIHDLTYCYKEITYKKGYEKADRFCRILKMEMYYHDTDRLYDDICYLNENIDFIKKASIDPYIFPSVVPNDSLYSSNQLNSLDIINMSDAWDLSTGSSNVKVGILDDGIALYNNNSPASIQQDCNDLYANINQSLSSNFTTDLSQSPFSSYYYHGTKVASILGSVGNNYYGMSGVCWEVDMVSLKIYWIGSDTGNPFSNVISAISYADLNGIKVLNFSYNTVVDSEGVRQAIENYSGLLVCSSGNLSNEILELDADEFPVYPDSYHLDNVITVGNSTDDDRPYINSVYGRTSVDLFAPGVNVCVLGSYLDNLIYTSETGTSFSSPLVAGVAALMLSIDSTLSPENIKSIILNNIDRSPYLLLKCSSGGRLNAYRTLHYVRSNIHFHSYEYSQYNDWLHEKYCSCGYYSLEEHTWTALRPFSQSDIMVAPRLYYTCERCGLLTTTLPLLD